MGIIIKTVLLTGATGYLGGKLLSRLLAKGFSVCVVKRSTSDISRIVNRDLNVRFYNNDIEGINQVFSENKIDLVIHTATAYGRKGESMNEIKSANLDFPLNILQTAVKFQVPYFINTGTSLNFLTNQYALFKNQFAECLQFFKTDITSFNVLLEHFYGPGDDESKFVTGMINKMKKNISSVPLTKGIQKRDFIFVEDVIDGYFCLIDNLENIEGYKEIPMGSGITVTIREIVEKIKELSMSSSLLEFGAVNMRTNELMESNADISLLRQMGWSPKYSLEEGLLLTINE